MLWWSPDPRAILPLEGIYVSRRLERRLRNEEFQVTCDMAFADVIAACAAGYGREGGTWLTPEMIAAYVALHRDGYAHSVETWREGELAGGIYGLAIGGLFAAESMFYRTRDGSKVALARLVSHLAARGYKLLDVQQATPHTVSMGVIEITRRDYLAKLRAAVDLPVHFGEAIEPWLDPVGGKKTAAGDKL